MRIMLVEPLGEGGICHYAYCLSEALQDCGQEIVLATGRPYELSAARRQFALATPFHSGLARRMILWRNRHGGILGALRGRTASASGEKQIPRAPGRARQLSLWLAQRDYRWGWQRLERLVRRQRPAVVHIQWLNEPEHDIRWLHMLRESDAHLILTVHNVLPHDAPLSVAEVWSRVYQAVDELIVHYQGAVNELIALGVERRRVHVIPHGNYLALSALAGEREEMSQEQARAALGLPLDAPVVLFFGYMRPYKGIEYLLDAFAHLHRTLPSARLLLAGKAVDGFESFARRIRQLGIAGATVALPHYLQLDEVARCFIACDVVAVPYLEASQSGVVQLAYAHGRPVVATQVGGLPEAVKEQATGLLVPPGNAEALASALSTIVGDRERCRQWGAQAYAFAQERYSWQAIARDTLNVYERAASIHPSAIGSQSPHPGRASARGAPTG